MESGGLAKCWGNNYQLWSDETIIGGQLGIGSKTSQTRPASVTGAMSYLFVNLRTMRTVRKK
jgi:hypothetical protein